MKSPLSFISALGFAIALTALVHTGAHAQNARTTETPAPALTPVPSPDELWANRATILPPIAQKMEDAAEAEVRKGNNDEAERIFLNALSTREQIDGPDHIDVPITLGKLSVFYWNLARYVDAERMVTRTIAIYEKHLGSKHIRLVGELDSLALVMSAQGQEQGAGAILERSLEIKRTAQQPDATQIAMSLERLGDQRRATDTYSEAESFYRQALALREPNLDADHRDIARVINSLGLLFQDQERYSEAEPLHRRALVSIEKTSGPESADFAVQLNNLGVLNYRLGDHKEASDLIARSIRIQELHMSPDHPELASLLSNLGLMYEAQDRIPEARAANARASSIYAERIRLGHMGRAEIDATRYVHLRRLGALFEEDAYLGKTAEAFEASQIAHASSAASAVSKLAERYALGGKADSRWVRIWQDSQAELKGIEKELTFLAGQTGSARDQESINALATRKNEAQLSIDATNEMLKSLYGEKYKDRIRPSAPTPDQIGELLETDEALLTITIAEDAGPDGADAVYLVVITKDQSQSERAFVPDLTGAVAELRRKLSPTTVGGRAGLLTFPTDTAHSLYKDLIEPFADLLQGVRHLLVVPDGALTSLPFGVLLTEPVTQPVSEISRFAEMPWLINRFAVSTLPSVASLRALRLARQDVTPASKPFIGIGDPLLRNHPGGGGSTRSASVEDWLSGSDGQGENVDISGLFRGNLANTRAVRELASLPETADELTTMANLLGADSSSLLLRNRAVENTVRKERALINHRILAFATHGLVAGEIPGQGAEPALVLTPPEEATPDNDGLLTASEVSEMRLNAQWVILSACNTAGSDGTPNGEGLSGLASAFFYAGAQSLFVSHWPVVSDATVSLTTHMLSTLKEQKDLRASEAHRQSMLAMMANAKEPMFAHPLFWAPFVVVGDGGVLR